MRSTYGNFHDDDIFCSDRVFDVSDIVIASTSITTIPNLIKNTLMRAIHIKIKLIIQKFNHFQFWLLTFFLLFFLFFFVSNKNTFYRIDIDKRRSRCKWFIHGKSDVVSDINTKGNGSHIWVSHRNRSTRSDCTISIKSWFTR